MNIKVLLTDPPQDVFIAKYEVEVFGRIIAAFRNKTHADLFAEAYEAKHTPMLADCEPNRDSGCDL